MERLLGSDALCFAHTVADDVELAWCDDGKQRFVLRDDASPQRINFGIARELARMAVTAEPVLGRLPESQRLALVDLVAASIVAPTSYVRALVNEYGPRADVIADACCVTLTCAMLRLAEVRQASMVISTPRRVYRRGRLMNWVSDEDVRRLVQRPGLRSVRCFAIDDEPEHFAFVRAS